MGYGPSNQGPRTKDRGPKDQHSMSDNVLLSSLRVLPLIGLVIVLVLPKRNEAAMRWVSLASTLATFVATLVMLGVYLTENRAQASLRERVQNNVVTTSSSGDE